MMQVGKTSSNQRLTQQICCREPAARCLGFWCGRVWRTIVGFYR